MIIQVPVVLYDQTLPAMALLLKKCILPAGIRKKQIKRSVGDKLGTQIYENDNRTSDKVRNMQVPSISSV